MMPRDALEYDYPPGLGYLRNGGGGLESQRNTFSPADRRGSAGFTIYNSGGFEEPNRHAGGSASLAGLGITLPSSSSPPFHHQRHAGASPPPNSIFPAKTRSTLLWSELEPWMDEEYAKQVCALMGWDPVSIKIPHVAPDPTTGQLANNPGYCFLTFPSQAHAASVLSGLSGAPPITMPNSTKPFTMNWASVASATTSTPLSAPTAAVTPGAHQHYPKEYSIFVGDLAPETSNSDLVAVFRNPVLGLRNDREPKFIRPFLSCKSAKIMLDPVTGVSRGYGFVRFTDEPDQQRALIEMHGLYCLSRPMRISPATAKFKAAPTMTPQELAQLQQFANSNGISSGAEPVTIAVPLPQAKSVSASIASSAGPTSPTNAASTTSSGSASSLATTASTSTSSSSLGGVSTGTGSSASIATTAFGPEEANVISHLYDSNGSKSSLSSLITAPYAQEPTRVPMDYNPSMGSTAGGRYIISEESWKHHTQARAILGNLIGPNGEQLTSTDPYNTTVFVGGLSPLIQEETLRTFFAPFGDIHYVKVPVGKHCGFVQFVRKADAERAIEKMQGFPIGGSRIRLSWGRSQYKAAQAAAQAAQAAAMQSQPQPQSQYSLPAHMSSSLPLDNVTAGGGQLTQEQAIQLLQQLSQQGYMDPPFSLSSSGPNHAHSMNGSGAGGYPNVLGGATGVPSNGGGAHALERMFINPSPTTTLYSEEKLRTAHLSGREDLVGTPGYDGRFDLQAFASQQQQQQHPIRQVQQSVQPQSHTHQHHPSQHMQQQQYQRDLASSSVPSRSAMSFSPFSPDPNGLFALQNTASDLKRRDSYPRPASQGVPGSFSEEFNGASGDGKLTPLTARPPSVSRYASYQGLAPGGSGSTGTSPVNRTSMPIPISRPSSGHPHASSSAAGAGHDSYEMHDLNGTLASLDLGDASSHSGAHADRSVGVADSRWAVKSPTDSSDSSASVQFQMTKEDVSGQT